MPMPLHHFLVSINLPGECAGYNLRRPCAQAHAPTFFSNSALLFQQRNDRLRGVLIEFGAICVFDSADVSCEFNRGHLHAETKAKIRKLVLARETGGVDFSFNTANAEPARYQNADHIL